MSPKCLFTVGSFGLGSKQGSNITFSFMSLKSLLIFFMPLTGCGNGCPMKCPTFWMCLFASLWGLLTCPSKPPISIKWNLALELAFSTGEILEISHYSFYLLILYFYSIIIIPQFYVNIIFFCPWKYLIDHISLQQNYGLMWQTARYSPIYILFLSNVKTLGLGPLFMWISQLRIPDHSGRIHLNTTPMWRNPYGYRFSRESCFLPRCQIKEKYFSTHPFIHAFMQPFIGGSWLHAVWILTFCLTWAEGLLS